MSTENDLPRFHLFLLATPKELDLLGMIPRALREHWKLVDSSDGCSPETAEGPSNPLRCEILKKLGEARLRSYRTRTAFSTSAIFMTNVPHYSMTVCCAGAMAP